MPPLGLHMTLARDIAGELASTAVDAERGAYYLGATTPDIRVLTRWDRARTHFFDLNEFGHQSGAEGLFAQEPALCDAGAVGAATAAFVAGYLSHLVMDESWICQIYRPLFGERSALRDEVMSDVMDRVLQFELDRREREDFAKIGEIQDALAASAVEVSVDFIARETLLDWRTISVEVLSRPPTWDRFRRIAGRHLSAAGIEGEENVRRFMGDIPSLLDRTIDCVGMERINEYLQSSRSKALRTMREYLS